MANVMPEWQGEEIVEDVDEVLGGKKRELPAALVRHRGRLPPPKKNAKNCVSPKAQVDIQRFECQAVEDDLVTESLSAPSPLNLEIRSNKSAQRLQNNATAASPPNKAFDSVRMSPDSPQRCGQATTALYRGSENRNISNSSGGGCNNNNNANSTHPRPPLTRAPGPLVTNPRQIASTSLTNSSPVTTNTVNKLISDTPNRLSPMNNVEESPRMFVRPAAQASISNIAAPSTSSKAVKPLPQVAARGLRRSSNTKSPPSTGSLDDGPSDYTTPIDSNSRKVTLPFSAPAGQSSLALRCDASVPTPEEATRSTNPSSCKVYSTGVPEVLAAKENPPPLSVARQPQVRRNVEAAPPAAAAAARTATAGLATAPVKPPLLSLASESGKVAGGGSAPPQPASRSRTVPRATPTGAAAFDAMSLNKKSGTKLDATTALATQVRAAAASPDIPATSGQPQCPANDDRAGLIGSSKLPTVGQNNNNSNNNDANDFGEGEYPNYEFFSHHGDLPVSDHEPRPAKQNTRNLNNSMMSSAGYSVLRGAYDSYANLDSTLPSLTNLNGAQNFVNNTSRAGSTRPPNMMTVNNATALRAKSSFARANSLRKRPQGNEAPAHHAGNAAGGQGTLDINTGGVKPSPKPATRAVTAPSNDKSSTSDEKTESGTPGLGEGEDSGMEKHRKRAPQTKRELRRRSTEFDEV